MLTLSGLQGASVDKKLSNLPAFPSIVSQGAASGAGVTFPICLVYNMCF